MDNKTITIEQAKKDIAKIANEVQNPETYYTIAEKGNPKAVIMSAEEFDCWKETLEVQEIFPNLQEDIKEAKEEYKRGEYITLDQS